MHIKGGGVFIDFHSIVELQYIRRPMLKAEPQTASGTNGSSACTARLASSNWRMLAAVSPESPILLT